MLSYWERKAYFEGIDFAVLGAGIVGMSAALFLKKRFPEAKVVIYDKSLLSDAASFKNAGFACFGSAGELLDDRSKIGDHIAAETLRMRLEGLELLFQTLGKQSIQFQPIGSVELFSESETIDFQKVVQSLPELNKWVASIAPLDHSIFSDCSDSLSDFGFNGLPYGIRNQFEGVLDTAALNLAFHKQLGDHAIPIVKGLPLMQWESDSNQVELLFQGGIKGVAKHLCIATNGFSEKLLPPLDLQPARAQVLITQPLSTLNFEGCFHMEKGFNYFRTIDQRILLGGGRHLNMEGETTMEMNTTEEIQHYLEQILRIHILPRHHFEIDVRWSGIMGVGNEKKPLIERLTTRVAYAVRMGGMGVAMGTKVGYELAALFDSEAQ